MYLDLQQMQSMSKKVQCVTDCVSFRFGVNNLLLNLCPESIIWTRGPYAVTRMIGSFMSACNPSYWPSMAANVMMYFSPMS